MTISFRVADIPQTKGSTKGFVGRSRRTGKLRAFITNDNAKNKIWTQSVQAEAMTRKPDAVWLGPVQVVLSFYLVPPQWALSAFKRGERPHPITKPDIDKLERSVHDALSTIIYLDDSQIVSSISNKFYGFGGFVGVEIEVHSLEGE